MIINLETFIDFNIYPLFHTKYESMAMALSDLFMPSYPWYTIPDRGEPMVKIFLLIGCFIFNSYQESISNHYVIMKMNQYEVHNFTFIDYLPETKMKKDLNKVKRIYFTDWSMSETNTTAINIVSKTIYIDSFDFNQDVETKEGPIHTPDVNKVLDILEEYDVQKWRRTYTFRNPDAFQDGYSWKIVMQFDDGTVEKHRGEGSLTPENYDEFLHEFNKFIDDRRE